jgi:hypothetical protein
MKYFFAAAADVQFGAQFEEAMSHAFAQAGASSGDEDAFVMEKIGLKHSCGLRRQRTSC